MTFYDRFSSILSVRCGLNFRRFSLPFWLFRNVAKNNKKRQEVNVRLNRLIYSTVPLSSQNKRENGRFKPGEMFNTKYRLQKVTIGCALCFVHSATRGLQGYLSTSTSSVHRLWNKLPFYRNASRFSSFRFVFLRKSRKCPLGAQMKFFLYYKMALLPYKERCKIFFFFSPTSLNHHERQVQNRTHSSL